MTKPRLIRCRLACLVSIAALVAVVPCGGAITFTGAITQGIAELGGAPVANPTLASVTIGDPFTVTLSLPVSPGDSGTYPLAAILFTDTLQNVSESAFISGTLIITTDGTTDYLTVLACLIDSVSCAAGNQLALNLTIPFGKTTAAGVSAGAVPGLLPLDLLEDNGLTDIHGAITTYAFSAPAAATPEPATALLAALALGGLAALNKRIKL